MRIAIVDDIAAECESLRSKLKTQLMRLSLDAGIFDYNSGEAFLSAAERERFDLVFLDIYIGEENGVDIAKALRRFDANCLLVFITTSMDHALDGFRVRAMHYLVKPYTDTELAALLDEISKRLPARDRYMIHIYRADGEKTVTRQTFREFTARLADERFFLCSRGMIVNLEHVKDFDGSEFVLKNETKIPVSRDLTKNARLAFGDFLFGRRERL